MELVRTFSNPVVGGTWIDDKSITNEMDFIVDELGPLCVNDIGDSFYTLLFFATQYSTEETIYLQLFLKSNDRFERDFLDSVPINMNNTDFQALLHQASRFSDKLNESRYKDMIKHLDDTVKDLFQIT